MELLREDDFEGSTVVVVVVTLVLEIMVRLDLK